MICILWILFWLVVNDFLWYEMGKRQLLKGKFKKIIRKVFDNENI